MLCPHSINHLSHIISHISSHLISSHLAARIRNANQRKEEEEEKEGLGPKHEALSSALQRTYPRKILLCQIRKADASRTRKQEEMVFGFGVFVLDDHEIGTHLDDLVRKRLWLLDEWEKGSVPCARNALGFAFFRIGCLFLTLF